MGCLDGWDHLPCTEAKLLPKFRFRVLIDKADEEWVKLDAQCIDTVAVGWFRTEPDWRATTGAWFHAQMDGGLRKERL